MFKNKTKLLLKQGKPAFGTWVTIDSPDVAEALSRVGFDWLVFDMEHAPLEIETCQHMMQAMNGTETTPIVRVAWNDMVLMKRVLDIGAYGVVVPWVNSRGEAEYAVKACRYPPAGVRGVGPRRVVKYGLESIDEYFKAADEEVLIIVQIETEKALQNLDEILSTPGVDACYVGPYDLSASLGVFRQFNHPKFTSAIEKILDTSKKTGVAPGYHAGSLEEALLRLEQGFKFIAITSDMGHLINSCRKTVSKLKSSI